MSISSYRDLKVWQAGIRLAKSCYGISAGFPSDERFGLVSQIRRASVSISANIAEGYGRNSTGDYVRFLGIARGSLREIETLLIIATEVGILPEASRDAVLADCEEIGKMLGALIRSITP